MKHYYLLSVAFSNGEHRYFDVKPYLENPFFCSTQKYGTVQTGLCQ